MIFQLLVQIWGFIFFFIPGILLSYILFKKADIISRAIYSITFSASIAIIFGTFLNILELFNFRNVLVSWAVLSFIFLVILFKDYRDLKTELNRDFIYLFVLSLVGFIWRLIFLGSIKNFGGAYSYSANFFGKTIPDLGFYTGMVRDHAKYVGLKSGGGIFNLLAGDMGYFGIFLITFLFLGFIYLIFSQYKNKYLTWIAVSLMSLGPIEIFHTTLGLMTHSLSYIALFSLFLYYKSKNKNHFYLAFLISIAMLFSYYTASMVILLSSIGFLIALVIKQIIQNKQTNINEIIKNKKIIGFIIIILISTVYIYGFSNMAIFTFSKATGSSTNIISTSTTEAIELKYQDPTFFGLSAIRWQIVFFFVCGLSFIIWILKSIKTQKKLKLDENNLDFLLQSIPIILVSAGFLYVNLPARIFDYFAFFGILVLKIPKKYYKIFFIFSIFFILITGFYVAKDKSVFFENPDSEISSAKWASQNLNGKIFSDQIFVKHLINKKYYNVTGTYDSDPILNILFYQKNKTKFNKAIQELKNRNVKYIAITERMEKDYILMLDYPQKPISNVDLFSSTLERVYDNGTQIYLIN